jgi:hypothetical protein
VDPVLVPPDEVPLAEVSPVWLAPAPFEVVPLEAAEPDAGELELELDVDELALADVDADELTFCLGVWGGVGVRLPQGFPAASAVDLVLGLAFADALAVAEVVVVTALVAVLVALAVAVLVAVVPSLGLAPLVAGLALVVPLAGLVTVAAGVTLGLADLAVFFAGDGEELGPHTVIVALARLLGMLLGVRPPAEVLSGAPVPSVAEVPLLLWEVNPTAEVICSKA